MAIAPRQLLGMTHSYVCHYRRVMSHTSMSHESCPNDAFIRVPWVRYRQAVSHICMSHESCPTSDHTATHCNTLQHTATHCNTLQHAIIHCNTLQHTAIQHLTCAIIDQPCHTHQWVMSHEPCHTHQRVMSHESWAMSHTWMSHESCPSSGHDSYERVTWHM